MYPLESLLSGIALTLIASALFTGAAERFGERAELGSSFLGSVFSPLFTSAPELVVLLVSVLMYGGRGGMEIGTGTVLGEPFTISTLAVPALMLSAVLGSMLGRRHPRMEVDKELALPYAAFAALYPLVLLPALARGFRIPVAATLVVAYAVYAITMYRRREGGSLVEAEGPTAMERLLGKAGVAVQLAISVPLLLAGSYLMVGSASELSTELGIPALSLSIVLVPLATALPETAASLIWAYRGRDTLALGALVGEMVMFSTVYPALGMVLTDWRLNAAATASVAMTELASIATLWQVRSGKLSPIAIFGIALYAAYVLAIHAL
ncbi:sodium:calcium antiporter [Conexivisphaera calida]|uniref:Sodium/calcium exchanger membrane region n=1 Tax=Conexivisphaera calida TaxID=1874277 RepID=A0A4P2VCG7_9ARCH|nr:sodium:calcium antiporter [Conexivisphaera calida]BBE42286.1 Sodium/calcium exchanger membrane region [Conexivisphaera calida]